MISSEHNKSADTRPRVAIIASVQAPYRRHVHQRISREIPEIELYSVFTHEIAASPWRFDLPEETNTVSFGAGENSLAASKLSSQPREWRKGGEIIRWLRRTGISAVVLLGYSDLGRVRIIRWCEKHRIPCYVWGDSNIKGDTAGRAKSAIKSVVVSQILSHCTGAMCCGRLGAAYFEKYGVRPERVFYFPVEPDYSMIERITPDAVSAVQRRFALDPTRNRFVFSGRLVPVKRADLLIDAFSAIAAERPNWDLLVIGDGPLRGLLESRVPVQLRPRITWTGFLDDQATISALYRASDVLVLPSDYEPWALVINEGAAAGLAMVSSDVVGAAAELLRDGANGRLFRAGDKQSLLSGLLAVTEPLSLQPMKAASLQILSEWRTTRDPVAGFRSALKACGVISIGGTK